LHFLTSHTLNRLEFVFYRYTFIKL